LINKKVNLAVDPNSSEDTRQKAISKRLSKDAMAKKAKSISSDKDKFKSVVRTRMDKIRKNQGPFNHGPFKTESKIITPMAEDEIVTKRKRVGY
jgi:hypothetical protein